MSAPRNRIPVVVFVLLAMTLVLRLMPPQTASGQGDSAPDRSMPSSVTAQIDRGVAPVGQAVPSAATQSANNRPQPRSANYRQFDFVIDAGGGVHTSASYLGISAVGQAFDSGQSASAHYQIASGYLAGSQAVPLYFAWLHLPLVLKNSFNFFAGPFEAEPNNSTTEANGPLRSGQDYLGYPNDAKDYFSFITSNTGPITITLTNDVGGNVQLQLFYQTAGNMVKYVTSAPYVINYTGAAGTYYIYLSTGSNYNGTIPYTLRVTYP
jgi:hypothetical protein